MLQSTDTNNPLFVIIPESQKDKYRTSDWNEIGITDQSMVEAARVSNVEDLANNMFNLAVAGIRKFYAGHEEDESIEELVDKVEMTTRGTIILKRYYFTSRKTFHIVSVSEDNLSEYHLTTFMKMGNSWAHSFDVQAKPMIYISDKVFELFDAD